MYCKKCGRFIGTDAELCDECKVQVTPTYEGAQYQFSNPVQTASYDQQPTSAPQSGPAVNLGRAIAAMILSTFGFSFMYAGIIVSVELMPAPTIVCMVLGLIPSILGLVFGAKSISNFKKTAHLGAGKRIPVLILGIASVVMSAFALFFALLLLALVALM